MDEFERLRGTNLAWFGLDELDLYAGRRMAAAGRPATRSESDAGVADSRYGRPRDSTGCTASSFRIRVEGYEAILAKPYENRFLLEQVPDFYERLRGSYDENFFRQEVLGDYLNVRGGLVYTPSDREKNVKAIEAAPEQPYLGAGFQCGSDVLGGGAGER